MANTPRQETRKLEKHIDSDSPYPDEQHEYWMQTVSGVMFRPYAVTQDMVLLNDIAFALANIRRFNGHSLQPYSVAQHSVYVSHLVPVQHAMTALMHDATEAYIGDMASPVKWGQKSFSELEQYIWDAAIAPKFGLPSELPDAVKKADLQMLVFELATIIPDHGNDWGFDHVEMPDLEAAVPNFGTNGIGEVHIGWRGMPIMTDKEARLLFLQRYWELRAAKTQSRL